MKWSQATIPTLREEPQEAEISSHKLMLRAGLIRRLAGGLYTFLPLGLRALRKVEKIVREEMDRAGALEVLMPALQPRELWDQSKRYDVMGSAMFKLSDRQNREMVLGPTHEEVITELVSKEISSYRQLPRTFYQIQTKFRDEIRPRFGLMRAKEFIMKDAYSFDTDWDTADKSYQAMYDAYSRIFERCGLRTKIVEADTGAMGGKWSHEFMVLADSGEDGIVECSKCEYAANIERAERTIIQSDDVAETESNIEELKTPGVTSIEDVSKFLKCSPDKLIKTIIYLIDSEPVAVCVPGDREVNESKIGAELGTASIELADDDVIKQVTGAPVGFSGPVGLKIPVYADNALKGRSGAITGANKADMHISGVNIDKDADIKAYFDISFAREGDLCPRCKATMNEKRGIEVGHVFKLGTKYSESFNATYLCESGKEELIVMGCYGIGVTRVLASAIEQSHDKDGIIWPNSIAPFEVAVLSLDPKSDKVAGTVVSLTEELEANGVDVLVDDREERPGVKFKDADLLGLPIRVVVGERSLAENKIELKLRTEKDSALLDVNEAVAEIIKITKAQ